MTRSRGMQLVESRPRRQKRFCFEELDKRVLLDCSGLICTVDTTTDELAANEFTSLREAIQHANQNPGTTIQFSAGLGGPIQLSIDGAGEDNNQTGDLDVRQPTTIMGNGVDTTIVEWTLPPLPNQAVTNTLSGTPDRIFHISALVDVQISGLTIRNGDAPVGGGIFFDAGLNPSVVVNSAITGVATNGNGGPGGTLTLDHARVTSNHALYGGGIATQGNTQILHSEVSQNHAFFDGGGIHFDPRPGGIANNSGTPAVGNVPNTNGTQLTIVSSSVSGNIAETGFGGGIASYGDTIISGSVANGNSGVVINDPETPGPGPGGIVRSNIVDNRAYFDGGGILHDSEPLYGPLPVQQSTITGNTPGNGNGPPPPTLQISDALISGNIAQYGYGGGVATFSRTDVSNSIVETNYAGFGGGGIFANRTQRVIGYCEIPIPCSTQSNGAPQGQPGPGPGAFLNVMESTISGNTTGISGGGIQTGYSFIIVELPPEHRLGAPQTATNRDDAISRRTQQSTVSGNAPIGPLGPVTSLRVADSQVNGNDAYYGNGGGIAAFGPANIVDSSVNDNIAAGSGGGIFSDHPYVEFVPYDTCRYGEDPECGPLNNNGGGGGPPMGPPAFLNVRGSMISGNAAGANGGGIAAYNRTRVDDTSILNNSSTFSGGGIHFGNYYYLPINGGENGEAPNPRQAQARLSTISGNGPSNGGGPRPSLQVTGSTIQDNYTTHPYYGYGGGIATYGPTTVFDSEVIGNDTRVGGGGIMYSPPVPYIPATNPLQSTVTGNTPGNGPPGPPAGLNVVESEITDNRADGEYGYGGGISSYGPTRVLGSHVDQNYASQSGGGISYFPLDTPPSNPVVSTVSGNTNGGPFGRRGLTVAHSTVNDNTAEEGSGGGIMTYGPTRIRRSEVSRNDSHEVGGGVGSGRAPTEVPRENPPPGGTSQGLGGPRTNNGGEPGRPNQLNIVESTVADNTTGSTGGGVAGFGEVAVTSSTISGNTVQGLGGAGLGGGLAVIGNLAATNTTISNNASYGEFAGGGGIASGGDELLVANSTLVGNEVHGTTDSQGAGILRLINQAQPNGVNGPIANPVQPVGSIVNNTIVMASVGAADCEGVDTGSNNLSDGSCPGTIGAAIGVDPNLAENGGPTQTHALLTGSNAINAGDNGLIPPDVADLDRDGDRMEPAPYDQRGDGFPRVEGSSVDIGSFELFKRLFLTMEGNGAINGLAFGREDIIVYDAVADTWAKVFDGDDVLPIPSLNLDAFTFMGPNMILMSFSATANFPGIGTVSPDDVLKFTVASLGEDNTAGVFEKVLEGDDVGLTGENVDALTKVNGNLVVSLARDTTVNGTAVDDSDLLELIPPVNGGAPTWSTLLVGTDIDLSLTSEDVTGADVIGNVVKLNTLGEFIAAGGASGNRSDVFGCNMLSNTCSPHFDGFAQGIFIGVDGLELRVKPPAPRAEADLSINKSDNNNGPIPAGSTLIYTVDVHNDGPDVAEDVVVMDTLPAGVSFVETSGCLNDPNGVPTCELGDLAPGAWTSYTIEVTVDATTSGIITNTATVMSAASDPDGDNNTDHVDTEVIGPQADLSIEKTDESGGTVTAGESLIYTLTIEHAGGDPAANVVVTDSLPTGVTLVDGDGCVEGPPGTLTCDLGDMNPGEIETIQIEVLVDPSVTGSLFNEASVSSNTQDPDLGNNSDDVTTDIETEADLAITKADSPDPVAAGGKLTYTINVTNNGPSDAQGVEVTDTLPGEVSNPVTVGCDNDPNGVPTCELGTIAAGASKMYTITVDVDQNALGPITNVASVDSDTPDPNPNNDQAIEVTEVEAAPTGKLIYFTTTTNPNIRGQVFDRHDIVLYDTVADTYSLFFDGSAEGLPAHAIIDAFKLLDNGNIVMSFASFNTIGAGDDPTDLFEFDGNGFTKILDGGANGLDNTTFENIDALTMDVDGKWVISTAGTANVNSAGGPLSADDEDLLKLETPANGGPAVWSLFLDGATLGLDNLNTEDINGVDLIMNTGELKLTTLGQFTAAGPISGLGNDVFACSGGTCSEHFIGTEINSVINGIDIVFQGAPTTNSALASTFIGLNDVADNKKAEPEVATQQETEPTVQQETTARFAAGSSCRQWHTGTSGPDRR